MDTWELMVRLVEVAAPQCTTRACTAFLYYLHVYYLHYDNYCLEYVLHVVLYVHPDRCISTRAAVERLWRDAKLLEIGGGTLEAHQKNMTREMAKLSSLP